MQGKSLAAFLAVFYCVWIDVRGAEAAGQAMIVNRVLDEATAVAALKPRRPRRVQYRTVYFATNRRVRIDAVEKAHAVDAVPLPTDEVFEEIISPGIAYGWADISYPRSRRRGDTGYNRDINTQNPYRDFTVDDYDLFLSREEFLGAIRSSSPTPPKSSLVFVHGFDVSFEDAAERAAQMSLDIDGDAVPIFFSWPSAAETSSFYSPGMMIQIARNYGTASKNSKQTRPYVGAFLSQLGSLAWPYKLIAHSMGADISGNALLASSLYDRFGLPDRSTTPPEAVVLVAPDIAENDFADQLAPALAGRSRVTVYCTHDWALWASRLYNGSTRLGWCDTEGRRISGVDVAVVSGRMPDMVRHSYFLGSNRMLDDISGVLIGSGPVSLGVRQINLQ